MCIYIERERKERERERGREREREREKERLVGASPAYTTVHSKPICKCHLAPRELSFEVSLRKKRFLYTQSLGVLRDVQLTERSE